MPSPLNRNHHRRRCRSVIVVSLLLSWTCEFSMAFTPIHYSLTSSHTSLSTSAAAPTDSSCTTSTTNLSSHHYHLTNIKSTTKATTHLQLYKKKHSPLEDEPWKKDDSYWDQLQAASKDPEQFEKFIEDTMAKKKNPSSSSSSSSSLASAYASAKQEEKPKKKGAYVPIEEWDASRSNKENMSSEERLQWECQQGGNKYRQNEILMHNLKSF